MQVKERKDAYDQTFGSDWGKAVLDDLMRSCHVLEPTYVQGDTHESAFREGQRQVALYILSTLKYNVSDYISTTTGARMQ